MRPRGVRAFGRELAERLEDPRRIGQIAGRTRAGTGRRREPAKLEVAQARLIAFTEQIEHADVLLGRTGVYPAGMIFTRGKLFVIEFEDHLAALIHLMSAGRLQLFDSRASLRDMMEAAYDAIQGAHVPIQQVGVSNFKLPLKFRTKKGEILTLEASITGTVSLEADLKGINMSRIVRSFYDHKDDVFTGEWMGKIL